MRRVSRGKAWLIFLCAPLVSAATAALCVTALTVPAHADHCIKRNHEYSDVIIKAMDDGKRGMKPMCREWRKALAAATALKELATRKDCYHGKIHFMAGDVKNYTEQETNMRGGTQLYCEFGECLEESGDVAITA